MLSPWGKKIEKYLGSGWRVLASYGHIRDLPRIKLGVDVDRSQRRGLNDFAPTYEISKSKTRTVDSLQTAAKKADAIYLAADPDREGEAIASVTTLREAAPARTPGREMPDLSRHGHACPTHF